MGIETVGCLNNGLYIVEITINRIKILAMQMCVIFDWRIFVVMLTKNGKVHRIVKY